jgi:hypothetical protein
MSKRFCALAGFAACPTSHAGALSPTLARMRFPIPQSPGGVDGHPSEPSSDAAAGWAGHAGSSLSANRSARTVQPLRPGMSRDERKHLPSRLRARVVTSH